MAKSPKTKDELMKEAIKLTNKAQALIAEASALDGELERDYSISITKEDLTRLKGADVNAFQQALDSIGFTLQEDLATRSWKIVKLPFTQQPGVREAFKRDSIFNPIFNPSQQIFNTDFASIEQRLLAFAKRPLAMTPEEYDKWQNQLAIKSTIPPTTGETPPTKQLKSSKLGD